MRRLILGLLFLSAAARADIDIPRPDAEDVKWQEEESRLPAFPQDKDLLEFEVSKTTSNHFFIDAATLDVGKDGVVRYTLVVKTAGGATNVTREGLHCDTKEYRLYAMGRADGTWSKTRQEDWRPIMDNKPVNRHHAALYREYFCPIALPIVDAEEGRRALRLGGNPRATSSGIAR